MAKKYLSLEGLAEYDALIKAEIDASAEAVKNDLLNGAGTAYDTLKELGDLIDDNQDAIEALEIVATNKADKEHNHDDVYETKANAQAKLDEAKAYTDTAVSGKANDSHTHAISDVTNLQGSLDAKVPTTRTINSKALSSNITLSASDVGAYTKTEVDTKLSSKADASHPHNISDVSGLQSALDGKAGSSHGTHVSYSTTAPVMDGTASVGSAATVARSDHKHPTDTSRASKTEFDTHVADTTKHITSTERTNWNAAKTHADSAHAPSNAEKNQNAFSNIAVSGQTTVAADTTTDTVTFVGSNVAITTDATNDKVTFSVAAITTAEIDAICGASVVAASEVTF